jgi:RimK family alpha-L-glutamate ligase
MPYLIGVLRHDYKGHAEEQLIQIGKERGLEVVLIDPFTITLGVQPDTIRNHGTSLECDGIVSRCEISSCLAPESEAYLRLLQFYEKKGVPIINSSQSIIKCQDKFRTHYNLSKLGAPTPKTFVTYEYQRAEKIIIEKELEFPIIIKKIYGSRGDGVYKVNSFEEMKNLYHYRFSPREVLLLQEHLYLEVNDEGEVRDYRIWVVRDKSTGKSKTMGGVHRNARNGNFRTNVSHGGYVTRVKGLAKEVAWLGEIALDAVSGDVAGIDIARTKDGNLYVEEVNISFDTGVKTQNYIGDIWSEVLDLLVTRIENKISVSPFLRRPTSHSTGRFNRMPLIIKRFFGS